MYGPTPPVPPPPSAPATPAYPPAAPAAAYPPPATYAGQPTPHLGRRAHPGYGFAPYPPQKRGTARYAGLVILRVVLTCVPLGSLGILSWVPLLYTAAVRRRALDWVSLGVSAVVATGGFITLGSGKDTDTDVASNVGMALLLVAAVGSTVRFLIAELRTPLPANGVPLPQAGPLPQPYAAPWPVPAARLPQVPQVPQVPHVPLVPLGQVQAELDELSALLRAHERPTP